MSHYAETAPLFLKGTDDEPEIILDREKKKFAITGRSLPEDPGKLFTPVINWVQAYAEEPDQETIVDFRLDYFNSSTARFFVEILEILDNLRDKGKMVRVNWWYAGDDAVMQERGEELESIVDMDFNFCLLD